MKTLLQIILLLSVSGLTACSPMVAPPPSHVHGNAGPQLIIGEVNSANASLLPEIYPNPTVVLLDLSNVITGHPATFISDTAQIMGNFTKPMFPLPGKYRIALPIQPQATPVDLDHNNRADVGVQVFALQVVSNLIGNSYLQQLEQVDGHSSFLIDPVTGDITQGSFLVYAPDDSQGFPNAIGVDNKWFTQDDPIALLPHGYSVARLNADGKVTLDRAKEAVIDTIERAEEASPNFADQGITESFNSLIDVLKQRYAYTELRRLDWEHIRDEYLPRVQAANDEADTKRGMADYYIVLDEMAKSIHDAHVSASYGTNLDAVFAWANMLRGKTEGNIGANVIAVHDVITEAITSTATTSAESDKVVVLTVGKDSPADKLGWVPGTEIVAINGKSVAERREEVPLMFSAGTSSTIRLVQTQFLLNFPLSQTVTVAYRLPSASETLTATMETGDYETNSIASPPAKFSAPVNFEQIDNHTVIRWNNFIDFVLAKISVLEEALALAQNSSSHGLLLDMRGNSGGWLALYLTMASYFFTAENPMSTHITDWYVYDQKAGGLVLEHSDDLFISAPRPELAFTGPVVILVDENCASSCEYFTQHLQVLKRATVVGQYNTIGAGGPIDIVSMPGGLTFHFTKGRTTFAGTDELNLEAKGVIPDVFVPVTLETETAKLRGEDPVMQAGLAELNKLSGQAIAAP